MKHYYQLSSTLYQDPSTYGTTLRGDSLYEQDNIWYFPNGQRVGENALDYISDSGRKSLNLYRADSDEGVVEWDASYVRHLSYDRSSDE